jgi:hypothetical protein
MFYFFKRKSAEKILKETPLQEVLRNISPKNEEYREAEEQMTAFQENSQKELEINSLELDKHMVSISGGAIGLLLAFLTFVQINNLALLVLRNFGFAVIILLTLCMISIVLSYMFAVTRAKISLEITVASKKLAQFTHKRPQDAEYWKEANEQKDKYCDLVSIGRKCNLAVRCTNKCAPIFFILGIISLAVFLIINLAKLSGMNNANDNSQANQQSQQMPKKIDKAADLPDITYDQIVANTIQALKKQNAETSKSE